jgi:hypothetical protein
MKIGSREYKEWLDSPLTKALKSSFEQSVTDPENQPSQYGTVTLAMYELVCKQRELAVEALEWACGEKPNDKGKWFDAPDGAPKYWWRTELRKALSAIKESEAK